jgi:asparagine synthase (glutamine-hydrolysing)
VEGVDPEAALMAWQADDGVSEALDGMLLADSMVRLPNHPVMVLDRMTMAHGLEARSPFLDHRLAEFAATLPVDLKVRGSRRRYIQMELARRYLPPEVMNRPKQGFSSALPYLMKDQYQALFRHFLPASHLVGAGLLREPVIREMAEQHLSGRVDHGNRLWLLLNAELWYRIRIEAQDVGELSEEVRGVLGPSLAGSHRHGGASVPVPAA